jgi:hypothetical protein
MVFIAFVAVYLLHPEVLHAFIVYYLGVVLMVMIAFTRVTLYTTFLWILSRSETAKNLIAPILFKIWCIEVDDAHQWITEEIARIWNQSVVYFVNHTNLSQLNRALQYIEDNEEARCVRVVHVHAETDPTPHYLIECVRLLDCVYPKMRLDCILVPGEFGPALIEHLANSLDVPVNCMFINCPKAEFRYSLDQLRGVRVILNAEKSSMLEKMPAPSDFMSKDDPMHRKISDPGRQISGSSSKLRNSRHEGSNAKLRNSPTNALPRQSSTEVSPAARYESNLPQRQTTV